ncbi:hypothetical protein L1049_012176 [Liquidambar formosana]|uniref:Nuclear receptor corepressor 1 n=1 Tax=Liquidambar formosana TaxID=63359 RepID=A0AAP0RSK7_LIQFO
MPPEPLPWDRKDFFKERKHERSESLGSVARWRDSSASSHHGSRDFTRWGPADFRRPAGHGKQGGWHMFSEESGHGYTPSRSGDKMLEDESCRPSSRDGKYRSGRENRGSYSQKDWKGHSWEISNGSPNGVAPGRLLDVNDDQRSVDDMLTYNSHNPHSDFVNGWDHVQFKDQHDKMGGVIGLGTGQRYERENSLVSIDWKPLKWTRSGSLSSRGSGFSHSSSSKSMGVDSNEAKADLQPRNVTPIQSPSGDAVACVTSAAPSEEMSSRKKPRLGWGEGLAKYEKKKVGPDESVNKNGILFCSSNTEPMHSLISNLADKSPRVTGSSDCASPATPSSVACSSSPGMEEKPYVKAANIDNDTSNLSGSSGAGFQNHLGGFSFNLENLDLNTIANLGSSLFELLQADDQSSVDSSFVRSTAMNKLLVWKGDILKALEVTESEIDSLENELKSLKSESGSSFPCPAASSSLPVEGKAKPCEEHGASNLTSRPAPLQVDSSGNMIVEKKPFGNDALEEVHAEAKDEDIDSPGTATSKFVEPPSLGKEVSPSDMVKHGECSGDLGICTSTDRGVECSLSRSSGGEKTGPSACGDGGKLIQSNSCASVSHDVSLHTDGDNILCDLILASNRESANRASEVINKLLSVDKYNIDIFGAANFSSRQHDSFIRERFVMRKRFLRFKERVITLKFRAYHHLWKEDIRLLSIRKNRAKSQKRLESGSRILHNGYQKHRSSIRSRFSSPAGNLSLVPTTEIINFTSKLLSDSQVKLSRNTLKMPALILDKKEKMVSRFISSNGLVEDPCAVEKERAMINPWMPEEKIIFMDKLATFGKDFRKIASFLDHRTTADCVEFYYKNHKSDCFEKTKKKMEFRKQGKPISTNTYLVTSGKRWNREVSAASLDMLGAASVIASRADDSAGNRQTCSRRFLLGGYSDHKTPRVDDGILEASSSFNVVGNERETVAADVLAGICGSISSEAMSSCITSSVDPGEGYQEWKCKKVGSATKRPLTPEVMQNVDDEICSDESCGEMDPADWTDEEKSIFIQAVSLYGKDFAMISRCVRTRSRDQCKVFFSKARKCLGLDQMHPGPGNVGTPVNDDANEGGSDTEDACVVETGSVICSNKIGSKLDEDLPMSVWNVNHNESDPGGTMNLQTDVNRSGKDNGTRDLDYTDTEAVENLVPDRCQAEDRPDIVFDGDRNMVNGVESVDSKSEVVDVQKIAVISVDAEVETDLPTGPGTSVAESVSAGEEIDRGLTRSNGVVETKALVEVSADGLGTELERRELLLPGNGFRQDENRTTDTSGQGGLQCSVQDSVGNAPQVAADSSSCSRFSVSPESQRHISLESDPIQKPRVISLQQNSLEAANLLLQNSAAIQYEKTGNQDVQSPILDFEEMKDKVRQKSVSMDDYHHHLSGHRLLNHVESSQILRGYPLQMPAKKEMNGDISCKKPSAAQSLPKLDGNFQSGGYLTQDCFLQKCNSSKSHSLVSELPLLSQNSEQTSHLRTHLQSSSDTEKPCKNGDVKLFGQILSHPSSMQKSNSTGHQNDDKVSQHPKLISKPANLKFTGHHSTDGSSVPSKLDRNNYLGIEPLTSYSFWDGSRMQTAFASMPDSAILLAKYPTAFSNFPTSSKIEQHPLQAVVKSNERNLNGVSVFPTREINSSNGIAADYQLYRSRDSTTRVQPFTIDMKQRQEMFTELQRRKGFEAVSSIQQQGRGVVGMNVVGRGGILVGGACTAVSDPVAALKMHYAKTEQYGGQVGSIIREDESWGGKGDLGR